MATLSRGTTYGASETITNTKLHNLVDLGAISQIVDADISSSANITDTKLADITTSNKVKGTAIGNIASLPTGAGQIPSANLTTFSSSITSSIIGTIYPVGSIYISTLSTNPGTLLGVGTWTAFGAGRTLVSLDSGQTEFDTVEETGGAKTHTLITAEMPAHTHDVTVYGGFAAGSNPGSGATQTGTTFTSTSTGGGGAHNNLQPYIVVYMWKRTA